MSVLEYTDEREVTEKCTVRVSLYAHENTEGAGILVTSRAATPEDLEKLGYHKRENLFADLWPYERTNMADAIRKLHPVTCKNLVKCGSCSANQRLIDKVLGMLGLEGY